MAMFLVTVRQAGPDWAPALPMEEQSGWTEHAAFMDELVEAGFIVLGGPLAAPYMRGACRRGRVRGGGPGDAGARSVERVASR